jgi:hypothetical protein
VAQVVEQRGADQLGRRAGLLGQMRALQRMLELRDAFAFVSAMAFAFIQRKDFLDHH